MGTQVQKWGQVGRSRSADPHRSADPQVSISRDSLIGTFKKTKRPLLPRLSQALGDCKEVLLANQHLGARG